MSINTTAFPYVKVSHYKDCFEDDYFMILCQWSRKRDSNEKHFAKAYNSTRLIPDNDWDWNQMYAAAVEKFITEFPLEPDMTLENHNVIQLDVDTNGPSCTLFAVIPETRNPPVDFGKELVQSTVVESDFLIAEINALEAYDCSQTVKGHPRSQWRCAVSVDETTQLGYWDWVRERIRDAANEGKE